MGMQEEKTSMKGQLGEFFGFSLALLTFGIIEGKSDQELD